MNYIWAVKPDIAIRSKTYLYCKQGNDLETFPCLNCNEFIICSCNFQPFSCNPKEKFFSNAFPSYIILFFFLFRFEIPVFHYGFLFLFKFMNRSFLTLFLCLCRFQVAEIPENTCLPFRCALFLIVRLDLGHFFCQRFFRLCFMKACYYILVQRRLFYFLVRRFCLSFRFSSLLFWLCLLFGFGFTEILSVIFIVWEDFFVSIYTTSAAVAAYGIIRMDRVCALEGLTATYEVASSCLRGTGKSLEPSVITILGTVVFRLIWLTTIFRMFTTYDMLMNVYVASWLFTGCSMFVVYFFHMRKIDKLLGAR